MYPLGTEGKPYFNSAWSPEGPVYAADKVKNLVEWAETWITPLPPRTGIPWPGRLSVEAFLHDLRSLPTAEPRCTEEGHAELVEAARGFADHVANEDHGEAEGECFGCGQPWPCFVERLHLALDALSAPQESEPEHECVMEEVEEAIPELFWCTKRGGVGYGVTECDCRDHGPVYRKVTRCSIGGPGCPENGGGA